MDQGTYHIRASGKDYGPLTAAELERSVKDGAVPFSAWVHAEGEWKLLAEIPELRERHPEFESKPKGSPKKVVELSELRERRARAQAGQVSTSAGTSIAAAVGVSADPIWFVIRDKKKFGPYSAADLVGQLQRKEVTNNSFVWRPGFATWQKLSHVGEFSPDAMRRLGDAPGMDILIKRKFPRAPYKVDVIAHDNKNVVEGQSMVIGEGGLFLAADHVSHKVGSRLKIHFRESDLSAFNAVAEVVSVQRSPVSGYCLRFVAISDSDRKRISKFVTERSSR